MNTTIKYMILLGVGVLLTSCSNYGYISENDVYMQAPTEINLEEDENDITSFNAFKARQKGAFTDEYNDPRLNNTMRFNQFMIINAYSPYGNPYGMYRPYGIYSNRPIGFHGMGWNDPYYNSNFYTGFGMGYGYYGMYGSGMYGTGFYNPYYAGYGYNPYFHGGYYGGYGGYYGGGYYGGGSNSTGSGYQQTVYYGQRRSLGSSSNRSSHYVNQQFKSSISTNSSNGNYDVNNQALGSSRRSVEKKYAGGSEYSTYTNENGTFTHNGVPVKSNNYQQSSNSVHRRAVNKTYTPNSSARRSGVIQQSRGTGVNTRPNYRGASSTPRSSGTRSNIQQTRSVQPRSNSSRSPRMSSPSRVSSPRSTSPSSGSSRRSSGSSSSSGRR